MAQGPPAEVGDAVAAIDTPALLLDLDAFEHNLRHMAAFAARSGVALRPHAKSHKCAVITERQVALGAAGICCQKVSEAESLIDAARGDVLVTYPILGAAKTERLARLARRGRVSVMADHPDQVAGYGAAARKAGVTLTVLLDIYPGGPRTGVDPGDSAMTLARIIAGTAGLRFGGLQAYNAAAQHIGEPIERRRVFDSFARYVADTSERLRIAGLPCATITGCGTGTYEWETESGLFTEIQPGSYIFMDAEYAQNRPEAGRPSALRHSLFVLTAVVSNARPGVLLVDAGVKALNNDPAAAWVWGHPELRYRPSGDEQGWIGLPAGSDPPAPGSRLLLVPGHCDPTVNLHDWIVATRGGRVEALWPVTARGAFT
jgi:D-serine deaminase-like pyridoxal phosphate-dependent protein